MAHVLHGIDYGRPFLFGLDSSVSIIDMQRGVFPHDAKSWHVEVVDDFLKLHYREGELAVVEIGNLLRLLGQNAALTHRARNGGVSFLAAFSAALLTGSDLFAGNRRYERYRETYAKIERAKERAEHLWGCQCMVAPEFVSTGTAEEAS